MESQELTIDDCTERKLVEGVHYHVVNFLVELRQALLSEIVSHGHLPALVVSSEQKYKIRICDFKSEQCKNDLHTIVTPIDVVA